MADPVVPRPTGNGLRRQRRRRLAVERAPLPQTPDVSRVERSSAADAEPAAATAHARVCFPFVGDSLGGSHMSALLLIEGLEGSGYEPVIVVHEEGPLTDHLAGRGLPYELLPLSGYAGTTPDAMAIAAGMLRALPRLAGFMRRHGIDIVHGNDLRTNLTWSAAAKLTGRPFVWHQRALPYSSSPRWRAVNLLADHVIHISNAVAQAMPAAGRAPASTIPNPVALPTAAPSREDSRSAMTRALGVDSSTTIIGFVGRLVGWKRPDVFVKAGARLVESDPTARLALVLVGQDEERMVPMLRDLAASTGIETHVHFAGFRNPIEEWIVGMDLLMATSDREPFGRTLIEAMALGTPVVAAAAAGHLEIVEHERNGLLVAPGDPRRLRGRGSPRSHPACACGRSERGGAGMCRREVLDGDSRRPHLFHLRQSSVTPSRPAWSAAFFLRWSRSIAARRRNRRGIRSAARTSDAASASARNAVTRPTVLRNPDEPAQTGQAERRAHLPLLPGPRGERLRSGCQAARPECGRGRDPACRQAFHREGVGTRGTLRECVNEWSRLSPLRYSRADHKSMSGNSKEKALEAESWNPTKAVWRKGQ